MEIQDTNIDPVNNETSRRKFLKVAGAAAILATAAGCTPSPAKLKPFNTETAPHPEKELNPSIAVLDFFDMDQALINYLFEYFPPLFSEIPSLWEMGITDLSTAEGLLKGVPKDENQAKLLLMMLFKHQYQNHGKEVISVMSKAANYLNPDQSGIVPATASIEKAVIFHKLEYDETGNPIIHANLSAEMADKLISRSMESVVNMSLEIGEFSIMLSLYDRKPKYPEIARQGPSNFTINEKTTYKDYQGNIITEAEYNEILTKANETEITLLDPKERDVKFLDGYAGDKTDDNLLKLAEIARKYPEKMIITAGGNPTYLQGLKMPDIREARKSLEEQGLWPDNLIIVGFQTRESGFVGPASYGADIYVSDTDLEMLGFGASSSYATSVITELTRQLISKGFKTHKKVKDALLGLTHIAESKEGSEIIEYRLLDLDRAKIG